MKLAQVSLRGLFLLVALVAIGLGWWRAIAAQAPINLSADDLKFRLDPHKPFTADLLPRRVQRLEGCRVRISGYMDGGSFRKKAMPNFVLATDLFMTYGPLPPDVVVAVELQPETTAAFTTRAVSVTGTFRIRELRGYNDDLALIYWLEDAVVEGAP